MIDFVFHLKHNFVPKKREFAFGKNLNTILHLKMRVRTWKEKCDPAFQNASLIRVFSSAIEASLLLPPFWHKDRSITALIMMKYLLDLDRRTL